jgi:hypothetical protein
LLQLALIIWKVLDDSLWVNLVLFLLALVVLLNQFHAVVHITSSCVDYLLRFLKVHQALHSLEVAVVVEIVRQLLFYELHKSFNRRAVNAYEVIYKLVEVAKEVVFLSDLLELVIFDDNLLYFIWFTRLNKLAVWSNV